MGQAREEERVVKEGWESKTDKCLVVFKDIKW